MQNYECRHGKQSAQKGDATKCNSGSQQVGETEHKNMCRCMEKSSRASWSRTR